MGVVSYYDSVLLRHLEKEFQERRLTLLEELAVGLPHQDYIAKIGQIRGIVDAMDILADTVEKMRSGK